MKQADFDRLKAVCEKEGFELLNEIDTGNEKSLVLISVKEKDIWEGVEFVIPNHNSTASKLPYKVVGIENGFVQVHCPYSGNGDITQIQKSELNPSTESAYIEQLKAEAFKRFGEIKEGDRFDQSPFNPMCGVFSWDKPYNVNGCDFKYDKESDTWYLKGCVIYEKGKWAIRVKERVKVDPESAISITDAINQCFIKDHKDFSKFIASKLEEYLNKESE